MAELMKIKGKEKILRPIDLFSFILLQRQKKLWTVGKVLYTINLQHPVVLENKEVLKGKKQKSPKLIEVCQRSIGTN